MQISALAGTKQRAQKLDTLRQCFCHRPPCTDQKFTGPAPGTCGPAPFQPVIRLGLLRALGCCGLKPSVGRAIPVPMIIMVDVDVIRNLSRVSRPLASLSTCKSLRATGVPAAFRSRSSAPERGRKAAGTRREFQFWTVHWKRLEPHWSYTGMRAGSHSSHQHAVHIRV